MSAPEERQAPDKPTGVTEQRVWITCPHCSFKIDAAAATAVKNRGVLAKRHLLGGKSTSCPNAPEDACVSMPASLSYVPKANIHKRCRERVSELEEELRDTRDGLQKQLDDTNRQLRDVTERMGRMERCRATVYEALGATSPPHSSDDEATAGERATRALEACLAEASRGALPPRQAGTQEGSQQGSQQSPQQDTQQDSNSTVAQSAMAAQLASTFDEEETEQALEAWNESKCRACTNELVNVFIKSCSHVSWCDSCLRDMTATRERAWRAMRNDDRDTFPEKSPWLVRCLKCNALQPFMGNMHNISRASVARP